MEEIILVLLVLYVSSISMLDQSSAINFDYTNLNEDVYKQQVNLMTPKKTPHEKSSSRNKEVTSEPHMATWPPHDLSKFEDYKESYNSDESGEHSRVKRRAKRRRGRGGGRNKSSPVPEDNEKKNASTTEVPHARRHHEDYRWKKKSKKSKKRKPKHDKGDKKVKYLEPDYVEIPKDLYQAHLRPGVVFRIHMSEAILKMQYRNYGEDKDESVIEADVEYLRLTRKVVSDEITKFEDLKWLVGWFNNRSELIQEHVCNTRYFAVGTPPTKFTHPEEYMKRMCLFDNVYLDHIPYVIGEDNSLMAAVAPPVLHCDAATCTSVPFIDSLMFDERLSPTTVHTVTRCQASCRSNCKNDSDCLKRCTDRCFNPN